MNIPRRPHFPTAFLAFACFPVSSRGQPNIGDADLIYNDREWDDRTALRQTTEGRLFSYCLRRLVGG